MITNQIENKLRNNETLSLDEVKVVLDYIVKEARDKSGFSYDPRKCFECNNIIGNLCYKYNILFVPMCIQSFNMKGFDHYYGYITFNSETPVTVIIDPTYIQFDPKYLNDKNEDVVIYINESSISLTPPGHYLNDKDRNCLVNDGYLTMTEEHFTNYISAFILSYKSAVSINQDEEIKRFVDDITTSRISFCDIENLEKEIDKAKKNNESVFD